MFHDDDDSKKIFRSFQIILAVLVLAAIVWYIYMTVHFFQTNQKAARNVTRIFKLNQKK